MKNYFMKYLIISLIILFGLSNTLPAGEDNWIFDWNTYITTVSGIISVPMPGEIAGWEQFYTTQAGGNNTIGLMLRNMNGPYDGSTDPDTLSDVMTYLNSNGYYLNFVFADFESSTEDENCIEMVNQVRAHQNNAINNAYIGNYGEYPGATDYSDLWGNFDRSARHNFYINSGMNIAMPSLYPYTAYLNHSERADIFGSDLCVSIAHALFWTPLERYSTAKSNLPVNHIIIPWMGGLIDNPGYIAPMPTKVECRALLQHIRLRGTDGYYTYSNADNSNYIDHVDFRDDLLHNGWQPLGWFFALPGSSDILNLTTNKTGGVEWSGMRRGNRCMFIFSNYKDTPQQVNLPTSIENIPDLSPIIASGEHLLMDYNIGPMSYWKFNENGNSDIFDTMEAGNQGGISGATWTKGKFGSGLLFDSNDYATIPDNETLDLSSDITVSFWIYPTAYCSDYAAHLAKKRAGTAGANFDCYFFGATAGSYYKKIIVYAEAGGSWQKVSPAYQVTELNKWYHIVWTYSNSNGGKLYVNGIDQGAAVGSGELSTNSENLILGTGFNGKIDEVKIYASALGKSAVIDAYSCNVKLRFDERQGSNVQDATINENDGIISGATWTNGARGSALLFTGNDYVSVANASSLNESNDITVSFWIYPTAYCNDYAAHLARKRAGTTGANFDCYFFGATAGSYYKKIIFYAEAGGSWQKVSPAYQVTELNKWYHIVWTYSSSNGGRLYVNGIDQGAAVGSGELSTNSENLILGTGFNGKMDEFKLYNRVLTTDEISGMMP